MHARCVPYLSAFSQYRQQRSQFQVWPLDMDIILVTIFAIPLDGNCPEIILQIKLLLSDSNGQLFAVAHRHITEQHIGAVRVVTDIL